MLVNQAQLGPGSLVGRYRLLKSLGRGGLGEVWLAEDIDLQRQVAAKFLLPVLHSEQEYLQAFHREARLAASLDHPHILSVHDYGELRQGDDVVTYLIMPYLEGGTLRERIEGGSRRLPLDVSLRYLQQAASAIDYAHSQGILHRDITPANILLQEDQLYLADFGIARLLTTSTYRSRTSAAIGSPAYMAPERIQERSLPASDLYSLAVIAYQLFTGRLPFDGEEDLAILLKLIQEPVPSPRQFVPQMPEAVERVLLDGLARKPEARPANCMAFVEALTRGWQAGRRSRSGDVYDPDATLIAPWNPQALAANMENRATEPDLSDLNTDNASYATSDVPKLTSSVSKKSTLVKDSETQMGQKEQKVPLLKRRGFALGAASTAILLTGSGLALGSTLYRSYEQTPGPRQLRAGRPVLRLNDFNDLIWNLCWNPRGRYLATLGNNANAQIWDLAAPLAERTTSLRTLGPAPLGWRVGNRVSRQQMAWSPDGRTLALLGSMKGWSFDSENAAVGTIDVFSPNATLRFTVDSDADAIHFYGSLNWSPSGQTLATIASDQTGDITLWHLDASASHKVFKRLKNPDETQENEITKVFNANPYLCWTQDEKQLLAYFQPFTIYLWDVEKERKTKLLDLPQRSLALPENRSQNGIIFFLSLLNSPTNATQFLANDVDIAVIFDIERKKIISTLGCSDPETKGSYLLTSYSDWDRFCPQIGPMSWSPNGRYVAGSYLSSNQIFVWDLNNEHPRRDSEGHHLPELAFGKEHGHPKGTLISDLTWSPDGRYLASSADDYTVLIWQVEEV
ncbi:WD40 repeat domain-containing serine/threonine protein kinase [Ktedonospora formicarum]|uniref:non-specific serine/threonine protein kinase n=1 Tax=Ktedonospora formicarum TaxID=2778364 RepID=A0A8J3HYD7_9CHLR|nr:serine/threonine-protein kinase [Ktedonospora formicarum]GHO46487.1 hypothetical protein KSX_46500 [Ktedonospora formicarum]